jgi:HK97 family phage portal protein
MMDTDAIPAGVREKPGVGGFFSRRLHLPWDGAIEKAASLLIPGPLRRGGWVGDPVTYGRWVDSNQWGGGWRDNGSFDYRSAVGDASLNAIVWACLTAISQAFPEPPLRVYTGGDDEDGGEPEALPDRTTPAVRLMRRPNPEHTWSDLAGLIVCHQHCTDAGTAYLWKTRSAAGRVVELWPIEPERIWPVAGPDTRNYITHYAYKASERSEPMAIPTSEIVKLTLQRDPMNPRTGRGPLRSALEHVFTDNEATRFMNAMLKNYGVPAAIASPAASAGVGGVPAPPLSPEATTKLRQMWDALTTGDARGKVLISPQSLQVDTLSMDPRSMLLDVLQRTPEGRICAVMGVPPIVALQVLGLENATYSNADQFYEGFTKFKMVPYWRRVGEQLTHQLLPDFYGDEAGIEYWYGFDVDRVAALQEDENELSTRVTDQWSKGLITQNEGRRKLGYPEHPDGDVYWIASNGVPTEPDNLIPPEPEPVEPPALPGEAPPQIEGPVGTPAPAPAVTTVVAASTNGRAR